MQFWKLQDRGDAVPYGVAAKDDDGLPRLFVRGRGLVHMPSVAGYTHWGEVGGHPVTEAEAIRMAKAGIGKMSTADADSMKGMADTIPWPEG